MIMSFNFLIDLDLIMIDLEKKKKKEKKRETFLKCLFMLTFMTPKLLSVNFIFLYF